MRSSIRFFCSRGVVGKITKSEFKPMAERELHGDDLIDFLHAKKISKYERENPKVPSHPGESGYSEAVRRSYRPDPMRSMRR